MAGIYEKVRALEVLDTRGEYGFVRIAVGQGDQTKIVNASPDEAEAFAQDILTSAAEARVNKAKHKAERESLRAENPELFEDDVEP